MNRLKYLRSEKGWTQEQVSQMLNISRANYSHFETGRNEPGTSILKKIANLYDVSVDYLIGNTNTKNSTNNIKEIDIDDFVKENGVLTFEGRHIPQEDLEVLKRLVISRKNEKEIDDDK